MILFSEYMNNWLYDIGGYYYGDFKNIGKMGDFYTSVSSSKFFGGSIAKHIIEQIENRLLDENSLILEVGSHNGYLLSDIIEFINTLEPHLIKTLKFGIMEPNKNLQKKQKEYFHNSFEGKIDLTHFQTLKNKKFKNSVFIVANELFDAFGVELIFKNKIGFIKNHRVIFEDIKDKKLIKNIEKYNITKGELAIGYETFIESISSISSNIHFLTFDYGEMESRGEFSIRIFKEHKVYPLFEIENLLETFYQKSDITSDVLFGYLIDVFRENEFEIKFDYQSNGLVDFGIIELLEVLMKNSSYEVYLRELNKVKPLIHPSFFGERFKMLKCRKG